MRRNGFDPVPELGEIRDGAGVQSVVSALGNPVYLVTRYEDVKVVTTDRRFSRAAGIGRDLPRMTPAPIAQAESINLMDPPEHNRLRRLVAQGFTNRQVERMRPATQRIVDGYFDEMEEHGAPADLAQFLSARLPLTTICEVLEIPAQDRDRLRGWAVAMMRMGPGSREGQEEAKAGLRAYFTALTAERRAHPGEDLISALATARDGDDLLDADELAVMAMVLLVTGHDTSTYQLSNITYALLTHPEQLAKLRARPESLPQALEELLRFIPFRQGPGIARVATEDVDLGAVRIRAGEGVVCMISTANRDEDEFPDGDGLDLTRDARRHLAFGFGVHQCLGQPLARLELQIALATLLRRLPELRLAVPFEDVRFRGDMLIYGVHELPLAW